MLSARRLVHIEVNAPPFLIMEEAVGEIVSPSTGIFDAEWIRSRYVSIEHEELELHMEAEKHATKQWAAIDPEFFRMIKKQVCRQKTWYGDRFHPKRRMVG
jgi:hypothetical protein